MQIYDCHIHSHFSLDGNHSVDEIVKTAIKKGAKAITITDHSLPQSEDFAPCENIKKSANAAKEAAIKYKDKILVLSGVERGDHYEAEYKEPFYDFDLDCVLGSVHSDPVIEKYFPDSPYKSLMYCSDVADIDFLKQVVKKYYFRLCELSYYGDVDIITHLTYPFRYINGKANRGIDVRQYYKDIDEVLKGIIEKDRTLEINTSGKATKWNEFMPDEEIIKRYYKMGGVSVSIGSDAHKKENIAVGFSDAVLMLKEIGFTHGAYYVKRKRQEYLL